VSGEILELLRHGDVEVEGRFTKSSNTTLLVTIRLGDLERRGVYKPESGERPLWDFPAGLWRREVAAYELDVALGLELVPPTVAREDLPLGLGSLQWYVEEDEESHFFTLRDDPSHTADLQRLAAFDVIANNSDRKSGHVLLGPDGLVAIDHGLCFHEEAKLRTVIWDYAGDPLDPELADQLTRVAEALPKPLGELLSPAELGALRSRAGELLEAGTLPHPDEEGDYPPYPWPLI
jgi:uncharacterized repeat protein (TIGR03843 family)